MSFLGNLVGAVGSVLGGVASAIPGIGPVASGIIGGLGNAFGSGTQADAQTRQAQEFQMSMLEKQYQNQLALMDKSNEWNSPVNQAKLYREAGINPFFALGNGQAGVGQSSTPASPSASGVPQGSFSSFNPDFLNNLRQQMINERVGKSQASLNKFSISSNIIKISLGFTNSFVNHLLTKELVNPRLILMMLLLILNLLRLSLRLL